MTAKQRKWLLAGRYCERKAAMRWSLFPYQELHVDPATKVLHSLSLHELALLAYFGAAGAPVQ